MSAPELDRDGALTRALRVDTSAIGGVGITIYPPTDKNPYHSIAYTDGRDRKVTSAGRTFAQASRKAQLIYERLAGHAPKANQTVNELLDAWTGSAKAAKWSLKYRANLDGLLTRYVRPTIGTVVCQELRREDVQRAVNAAGTEGEGMNVWRRLRTAIRWGYATDWIVTDPAKLVGNVHWSPPNGTPGMSEGAVRVQGHDALYAGKDEIPDHEAVAKLAEAFGNLPKAPDWAPLMVMVAAYSGVRLGELLALKAEDLDTGQRRIAVKRQLTDVGTTRKLSEPKGRKRRTTVYPAKTPATDTYPRGYDLAKNLAKRAAEVKKRDGDDGFLFTAPRGGLWTFTNFYRRRFHPAALAAGWPTHKRMLGKHEADKLDWTWHSLRHVFCAYYLWEKNAEAVDVSIAAGHSSVDITLRIYASAVPNALDRLNAV